MQRLSTSTCSFETARHQRPSCHAIANGCADLGDSVLYLLQQTPKRVLQLYNCTWLHHTLCSLFFPETKVVTKAVLFGIYLHLLGCHAGPQYELLSLQSVNTESEERLFGQVKRMANQASNRRAENVLFNMLV